MCGQDPYLPYDPNATGQRFCSKLGGKTDFGRGLLLGWLKTARPVSRTLMPHHIHTQPGTFHAFWKIRHPISGKLMLIGVVISTSHFTTEFRRKNQCQGCSVHVFIYIYDYIINILSVDYIYIYRCIWWFPKSWGYPDSWMVCS